MERDGAGSKSVSDERALENELERIELGIAGSGGVFARRIAAVNQLTVDLTPSSEGPSIGMQILAAAATAALGVATGGIAGIIAAKIASRVAAGVAATVEKHLKTVISATLSAGVRAAIPAAFKGGRASPSRGAFLRSQQLALMDTNQAVGNAFITQKDQFRDSPDGLQQAKALADAYTEDLQFAWDRQYVASLAEWSHLVDSSQRSTARSHGGMDTTAEGILGVDIDVSSPGADMRITGAHLEGIPSDARKNFRDQAGNQTLGELAPASGGMTIRVIQEGHSPGLFGSRASQRVRVAFQSRPGARANLMPALTGSQGMFVIDRVRQRFDQPDFAQQGRGSGSYDYGLVPVAASVIWSRELESIRIASLPDIQG